MSEQQIPGVPEGCRLKGLGHAKPGQWTMNHTGSIRKWVGPGEHPDVLPILECIDPPKECEAVVLIDLGALAESQKEATLRDVRESLDYSRINYSSVTIREKEAKP